MNTSISIERSTQNDILHVTSTFLSEAFSYVNGSTLAVTKCKHCIGFAEALHTDDLSFVDIGDKIVHEDNCPVLSAQRVEKAISDSIVQGCY